MPRRKPVTPPPAKPKPLYVVKPKGPKRFIVIGTYPDGSTDPRPRSAVDDQEYAQRLADRFNGEQTAE